MESHQLSHGMNYATQVSDTYIVVRLGLNNGRTPTHSHTWHTCGTRLPAFDCRNSHAPGYKLDVLHKLAKIANTSRTTIEIDTIRQQLFKVHCFEPCNAVLCMVQVWFEFKRVPSFSMLKQSTSGR